MRNIVQNIPHSSVVGVFDRKVGLWPHNPQFFEHCVKQHADLYTDLLFASSLQRVRSVVFPYSRFVCDMERLDNDPMEAQGQGIVYTRFGGYERGALCPKAQEALLRLRQRYLDKLSKPLTEGSILINCHSFTPTDDAQPDICIGYNDDASFDPYVRDTVLLWFSAYGFSVAENTPYANSITPPSEHRYASIMIDVNKRLYLRPGTDQLTDDPLWWKRWYHCLDKMRLALSGLPAPTP